VETYAKTTRGNKMKEIIQLIVRIVAIVYLIIMMWHGHEWAMYLLITLLAIAVEVNGLILERNNIL